MKNKLGIIGCLSVVIFLSSCASDQGRSITEKNKELILTMNLEIWNKGNLAVIDELYSQNFVGHFLPDGSDDQGIEALQEHVKKHREAFPDWREEIKHIVAEKDLVVIQFESSGTNHGSWAGNPPTGKKVRINEFAILRIEKGKIAEQWLLPDINNLRKQLGLDDR